MRAVDIQTKNQQEFHLDIMNPCVFIIFSLLLLLIVTTTSSQLVRVGEGGVDADVVMNKCLDKEIHALLLFKAPLKDPDGGLSTWTADEHDCCKWRGITCNNQTGHVTKLEISNSGLVGEISHSLLNLSYLNHLDLSINSFHGNIPIFIGSMTQLIYLDLSDNSFYGTIPPEFENLTNLQHLQLSYVGRCRVEKIEWLSNLSHLEKLELDGISLAKQNHWVDVILSLPKLSYLSLEGCELSQVMYPYSSSFLNFSSSSSSIEGLYLGNNSLTSSMYRWLFLLTSNKLGYLDLSYNMLDGIPKYLGNLCSLEYLEISNNSAAVQFPDFLNNLSGCTSLSLQWLDASDSQFIGSLSNDIQKFSSLEYLDLSHNHLNGIISDKLWELPGLGLLDVSFNNLTVPSTYHLPSISYVKKIYVSSCKVLMDTTASLHFMNQEFAKLDQFDGQNYTRWAEKVKFMLHVLKLSFVLDPKLTLIPENPIPKEGESVDPAVIAELEKQRILRRESEELCVGHIKNSLSDRLYDLYSPVKDPKELWNALELKYKAHEEELFQRATINRFSQDVKFYTLVRGVAYGSGIYVDHAMIEWQGDEHEFFSTLKLLKTIDLSSNKLTGQIPYEITNLSELIALSLSKNSLFGEIPQKIGRIPSSTQLQSFEPSIYDGNSQICGLPLTKKCPGDEESEVPPVVGKSKSDEKDIDEFWGWFYVGGGTGFAIGFWIACGALLLNRRGRRAFFSLF
ncbi:hypothetical protein Lser_V15G28998 [Lactuca serriola]